MELRVRSATNQAAGVRDDAISISWPRSGRGAHGARCGQPVVLVGNPVPRHKASRFGVEEFVADVPVGRSAPTGTRRSPRRTPTVAGLGPVQVLDQNAKRAYRPPRHYPDNDLFDTRRRAGRRRTGTRRDRARSATFARRRRRTRTTPRSPRTSRRGHHTRRCDCLVAAQAQRPCSSRSFASRTTRTWATCTRRRRARARARFASVGCAACTAGRFAVSSR
jgi:hypothetical protein